MQAPRQLADPERDGTLYVYDLAQAPDPPTVPDVRLRPGSLADVQALREAMQASGDYPDDAVETRQRDGRYPYLAEADGKVVSYGWVALSTEPVGDLGLFFQLRHDDAYIYDCATRPEYRGRRLYPALLQLMVAELRRSGRHYAWIGTAPGNVASQHGITRAGFAKVADVNFTRRPDGSFRVDLYGVPGIPVDLLQHAAWAFHGRGHAETGLPQG